MTALICVVLTGVCSYFSFGLGHAWWLAWLAPVPVLWLVFGETASWKAFLAAWTAFALGLTSLERAYGGVLPGPVLALDILLPALLFAIAASGARRAARAFGPIAGMFTFAALWAGLDLLLALDPPVGTMLSPASAELGAPMLLQSASLVGFSGVTFLLGAAAAGMALSLRTRNPAPVLVAAALFGVNAAYGYWRVTQPPTASMRVALINSNTYGYWPPSMHDHQSATANGAAALRVIDAYTAQIDQLRGRQVQLVVLPENLAPLDAPWRDQAWAKLAAAADTSGATIVAGFNMMRDGARRNVSLAFTPGAHQPTVYEKRNLVPVAESHVFAPGAGPSVLKNGIGLEICLDMDSPGMIRRDEVATRPKLLAVPAGEIGTHGDWANLGVARDDWFHARDAMLRSVEDGVPMARSAGRGLLTLTDRYGRVVAQAPTAAGFTTLVGELPLSGRGGATVYDRIGDVFGWLCLVLGAGIVGASLRRGTPLVTATASALLLGTLAACFSQPAAADEVAVTYTVGIAQRTFVPHEPYNWRHARTHMLLATVWYPAAATSREEPQWMGEPGSAFASAGAAAPDAAPAATPARFPLIVISHGTGGSALAMAWLGTWLAAHGFIAVAVNHPGNNALEPHTVQGFTLVWLRARDLSAVIDGMLADRRFGPRIDTRRIGAAGFSLGGYTMMELAGGRTSPAFFDLCSSHPRDRNCKAPPEFPTLVTDAVRLLRTDPAYRAAVHGADECYRDPRVRAVFAIAPPARTLFLPDSLAKISIPVEIVAGAADPIEPVAYNAKYLAAHIPGSKLVLFPGATHYTFFATCTGIGRKAQPGLCDDPAGIDRDQIHERAAGLAVAFFRAHLR